MENVKLASVVKVNPATQTVSNILSTYVTTACPSKNNREDVLVNTKNLPVTAQSPVLPSGHYLQIPTHAKIESVPATLLPPTIQQKILSGSNASGACEITSPPPVIYMSPVHKVKTAVPELLQTVCPIHVAEVSNPISPTVAKTTVSNSGLGIFDSQEKQAIPMKWVVQENPQSSASCLVPVKSSNIIASKVLKTLADTKNEIINPAKVLPASVNDPNECQARMSSNNDNTLVMYNGKVYFLVKKPPTVSTDECSKQVSPSAETRFRKNTLQLLNSAVNLVLSKNKQITSGAKDFKSSDNSRLQLQSELNQNLKVVSSFISPQQNLQISSTGQYEIASVSQRNPGEMNVEQKSVMKRKASYAVLHKIISPTAATASAQSSRKQGVSEDEKQKAENILRMAPQIKDGEEQEKQYMELRKKFGLFKEERLHLKRICLSDIKGSEATNCSGISQRSVSSKLVQAVAIKSESEEEEKLTEKQDELNMKRSRETPTILENVKRRKIEAESLLNPELEDSPSCSGMDGSSSPCRRVASRQGSPISFLHVSQGEDASSNASVQSEERNIISSPSDCCEDELPLNEGSFKEDIFPCIPPDLEDTIRDEKITKLKLLLKQREAALEEIRKQMQQT